MEVELAHDVAHEGQHERRPVGAEEGRQGRPPRSSFQAATCSGFSPRPAGSCPAIHSPTAYSGVRESRICLTRITTARAVGILVRRSSPGRNSASSARASSAGGSPRRSAARRWSRTATRPGRGGRRVGGSAARATGGGGASSRTGSFLHRENPFRRSVAARGGQCRPPRDGQSAAGRKCRVRHNVKAARRGCEHLRHGPST